MMTGYATDHKGDCYRMWDSITNGINKTRDVVIWLHRMFYNHNIGQNIAVPPMVINGIDEPTPKAATWEGNGDGGNAGGLPREGDATGLDNPTALEPVTNEGTKGDQEGDQEMAPVTRSSSKWTIKPPADRLIEEIMAFTAAANYEIALTVSEEKY
jgi:hypothetical protein